MYFLPHVQGKEQMRAAVVTLSLEAAQSTGEYYREKNVSFI